MDYTEVSQDYITKIASVSLDEKTLKIVVSTAEKSQFSKIKVDNETYTEFYNHIEPYERRAHVFFLPKERIRDGLVIPYFFKSNAVKNVKFIPDGQYGKTSFVYKNEYERDMKSLIEEDDSKITVEKKETRLIFQGVEYASLFCKNKDDQPVRIFTLTFDTNYATFLTGTPDNDYKAGNCSQTVEGEAMCAKRDGYDVIAATNADFFEIHGDLSPAGLVVKNGKVVANPNSDRPFFAIKKDGKPVISSLLHTPVTDLAQAVCGRDIIMQDGKPGVLALLEPFGYRRHPRTCVGLKDNEKVVIAVVDSRIPDYSNGATMTDLYLLMKSLGCHTAVNMDGGGSSTLILKKDDGFEMVNHPADLYRPFDNLIRDVYDTILVVKKK